MPRKTIPAAKKAKQTPVSLYPDQAREARKCASSHNISFSRYFQVLHKFNMRRNIIREAISEFHSS